MGVENFNTFQENLAHPELSDKELRIAYLKMQVELAEEDLGFTPDSNALTSWVEKHSADFGVIVTENPHFVLDYLNGGNEGREALKEVQKLMHEKHGVPN